MFFNVKGTLWTLFVLLLVALICILDLKCSNSSSQSDLGGSMTRVKREMSAGKNAYATLRREQVAEQLRTMRALNKQLVEQGDLRKARSITALILELEKQYEQLDKATQGVK